MRSRIRFLRGLILVAAIGLVARLAYLQVWASPHLSALARAQRTRILNLASLRRDIVDRNGAQLAVSEEAWSVYLQPQDFKDDPAQAAARLAPLLGVDETKLGQTLAGHRWAWLARQEDRATAKQVRALKIAGIGLIQETKRVYPKDETAGTLIGFVGVDNRGLAGIEHDFNSLIMGPPRQLAIQVDAKGNEILRDAHENPLDAVETSSGAVQLTIDQAIQHVAESRLAEAIQTFDAAHGVVIVMNPWNGDVLAFATLPTYDPNHPDLASPSVITNWGVSKVFEPGSVMKPFTISAALQVGTITPQTSFTCPPRLQIGDRSIGDHDPGPGIRHLVPAQILKVSSNVGASQIGLSMPDSVQRAFLIKFGFGRTTDSGLGGESRGILPPLPWRPIRHATISYGQGISVTALQLATAECALANGGYAVRPRLIERVLDANGKVVQTFPPAPLRPVVSTRVTQELLPMLEGVTDPGGTGTAARVPGYHVAGKTGTAQKAWPDGRGYSPDVVSTFLGFVPAEKPRIVILATLDAPQKAHFASETTAPIFRDVAAATLRILGSEPSSTLEASPSV